MSQVCSLVLNPLFIRRSGTSLQARYMVLLDPASVPIDDHAIEDDIVFSQKLSARLNYFNNNNAVAGNWERFLRQDISTQLSLIVTQKTADFTYELKKYLQPLQEGTIPGVQTARAKTFFGNLYSALFSLAWQIERMRQQLPDSLLLKSVMQALITTRLKDQLEKLRKYYEFAKTAAPALVDTTANINLSVFGEKSESAETAFLHTFPAEWNSIIVVDPDIYGTTPGIVKNLYSATNHNFFKDAIDVFIKAVARITEEAHHELDLSLGNWDSHEPHSALFLAFLKLLQFSRNQLNELTKQHLDLYYRQILRLKPIAPLQDKAYITFTLARFTDDHLVQKGTLLKAGKLPDGTEAFYTVDEDLAVNTATISHLQSVFISPAEDAAAGISADRIYSSPKADSKDGNGLPFDTPLTPWHPFAKKVLADYTSVQQVNMPVARTGFGFASHFLFLREGNRTITITVQTSQPVAGLSTADFIADITTAAGWEPVTVAAIGPVTGNGFSIVLIMASTQPSTAPWKKAVHAGAFDTSFPVIRLTLNQDLQRTYAWHMLKNTIVTSYQLLVSVDRVKNIYVQNDSGSMDPTKPFLAFGAVPHIGSMLLIGCDEIFQKNGAIAKPVFIWRPGTVDGLLEVPELYIFRSSDSWLVIRHPLNIFDTIDPVVNGKLKEHFYIDELTVIPPIYSDVNTPFSPLSTTGYVRYNLTTDLGYQQKLGERVAYLSALARGDNPGSMPTGVFIPPTVQEIYLQYEAATSSEAVLYHLYPFGEKPAVTGGPLMPQFFHDATNAVKSLAEFYIGLQNFTPPRKVSILFQVDESTSNPLITKPEKQLRWHYLAGDTWLPFDSTDIVDGTDDLISSGIISFSIPRTADNKHHELPEGQYWIKATLSEADEAVCKIIAVVPQAVSATFQPGKDINITLASPLPANTIAKMAEPQPEIKTLIQPFSSFGGTPRENDKAFYTRCSELLRHKGRSVNTWDYENLILQQFPNLYRAKCIPHTKFQTGVYNELAPGHVTVITIPSLCQSNGIDPLRPFTYASDLHKVKEYLQKLISPFVQLHICNPEYEKVRVEAKVHFYPQYDETLFTARLKEDITRFLAPWAYNPEAGLKFESRITNAMIVDFMEEQYYVDYVTDVKLYHAGTVKETVEPDRQSAIIVPVKAAQHIIIPINTNTPVTKPENGKGCGCPQ